MIDKQKIFDAIVDERNRQDIKWGMQRNFSPEKWLVILMEEVGELCETAQEHDIERWREELVQVAAVAFAMMEFDDSIMWNFPIGVEQLDANQLGFFQPEAD